MLRSADAELHMGSDGDARQLVTMAIATDSLLIHARGAHSTAPPLHTLAFATLSGCRREGDVLHFRTDTDIYAAHTSDRDSDESHAFFRLLFRRLKSTGDFQLRPVAKGNTIKSN